MAQIVTAPEPRLGGRILSVAEVCDAVASALHAASLSQAFVAVRQYLPKFDLADAGDLLVFVTPGNSYTTTRVSRDGWQRDPQVAVVIVKRLETEPYDGECDELMAFVEEVRALLGSVRLPEHETWKGQTRPLLQASTIEQDPVISTEALETMRQFTSVLTITYRIID